MVHSQTQFPGKLGEFASDYVELRRHYWDAPTQDKFIVNEPEVANTERHYVAGDRHGKLENGTHMAVIQEITNEKDGSSRLSEAMATEGS